ncbi:MAG: transcriptional regulator [Thaumarchaeota archaeon]|nr:transcriptional regulator [Nitrososphaerota archaeon]
MSEEQDNSLSEVFMELAGESRYAILLMLEEQKQRSVQLAKELNLTIQETHRNTVRLADAGLIKKDSDGFFSLTPYGRIMVSQLGSFGFLNKYKEYFGEHFPSDLPSKFLQRIGNLSNCELIHGNFAIVDKWLSLAEDAKEYLRIMTAQIPPQFFKLWVSKAKKGLQIFLMHGENTIAPKGFKKELDSSVIRNLISEGIYKRKMVKKIQTMMVMNEKRGILFFPDSKGESDMYYAFISDDPDFHEWCVDYFDYIWNKAGTYEVSKIREI